MGRRVRFFGGWILVLALSGCQDSTEVEINNIEAPSRAGNTEITSFSHEIKALPTSKHHQIKLQWKLSGHYSDLLIYKSHLSNNGQWNESEPMILSLDETEYVDLEVTDHVSAKYELEVRHYGGVKRFGPYLVKLPQYAEQKFGADVVPLDRPNQYHVRLNWDYEFKPSQWSVFRKQSGNWEFLDWVHRENTGYTDNRTLVPGRTYSYRLIYYRNGEQHAKSLVKITIPKDIIISGVTPFNGLNLENVGRLFFEQGA